MDWILPAYVIALALLSHNSSRFESTEPLKRAWGWLAAALILIACLAALKAGFDSDRYRGERNLLLLAIWTQAFVLLFVGISAAQLTSLFKEIDDNEGGDS